VFGGAGDDSVAGDAGDDQLWGNGSATGDVDTELDVLNGGAAVDACHPGKLGKVTACE
jgi:hypothetical protein